MAHLLTADEATRIEALVREVEASTAGEIVIVVAGRCDSYAAWRAPWVAVLTVASALLLYLYAPAIPAEWIFPAQLPIGAALWWLCGRAPVLRRLVPEGARRRAVADRTRQLFIEHGVTETRDRSGVLLLISELEHRIEILSDRGIHARVGDQGWEAQTARIRDAIRAGRTAEGLSTALREIGQVLAESFPPRPDDTNELSDAIQRVD